MIFEFCCLFHTCLCNWLHVLGLLMPLRPSSAPCSVRMFLIPIRNEPGRRVCKYVTGFGDFTLITRKRNITLCCQPIHTSVCRTAAAKEYRNRLNDQFEMNQAVVSVCR